MQENTVQINGKELIKLGGDPKIIKICNYSFIIGESVTVLEITKVMNFP